MVIKLKKRNKRARASALHSAFDHNFTSEDVNLTYAFDEKVLKNLNVELALSEEQIEPLFLDKRNNKMD